MLSIRDKEHFDKVTAKAKEMGLEAELKDKLDYLEHYRDDECVCVLYPDFAPLSFYFEMFRPKEKMLAFLKTYPHQVALRTEEEMGKRWFNGGLIYHGTVDGTYTDPLSVEVNPSGKPHWSVHT